MSELRIYLSTHWRDAASACDWALLNETGAVLESGVGNLASMPRADRCVAIVAADRVLSVPVRLPKVRRSQLETALPYALEEFLLGDIADSHVVPGVQLATGQTVLYTMDREWLASFVKSCEAAQLRLRRVIAEYCALPVSPGEWSAVWDGRQGLVATGSFSGGALGWGDASRTPAILPLMLTGAEQKPEALRVFFRSNHSREGRELPRWEGVDIAASSEDWDWARAAIPAEAPNLLWGKFAPPARLEEWWPRLRPAFLLLLVLFGVEAVGTNLEWWMLAREKRQLEHTMDSLFQETFGTDVTIVDAPLQMRRSLARLRHGAGLPDDADFVPLLEMFAFGLATFPGSRVNTLRYAEGQMDVEAHLPDARVLDTLQQRMAGLGLRMQRLDSRESSGGVDVHFRLIPGDAT